LTGSGTAGRRAVAGLEPDVTICA